MRSQLSKLKPEKLVRLCDPIVAVLVAFVVSGLVVVISGGNPLEAYAAIAKGAFGSATSFRNTLRYTFPILLLALSFNLCDKCGYFNIGQEGQMYASVLVICWIQRLLGDLPQPLLMLLMIVGAMAAGGLVSLIPAALKFLLNINEVVVAILINNLLISLSTYMLLYSGIAAPKSSVAKSLSIVPRLPLGAVLTATVVILIAYALILRSTVPGFRLRMIGMNPAFARSSGLHTMKSMLIVAVLGGALAGLAASGEILSVYHETYSAYADGHGLHQHDRGPHRPGKRGGDAAGLPAAGRTVRRCGEPVHLHRHAGGDGAGGPGLHRPGGAHHDGLRAHPEHAGLLHVRPVRRSGAPAGGHRL